MEGEDSLQDLASSSNDFHAFSQNMSQRLVDGHNPPGCGGHSMVSADDILVLLGGADRSVTPCSDTVILTRGPSGSLSARAIDTTLNCEPFKLIRTGSSAVAMDECVYMFGGQEPTTGLCRNDIMRFDIKTRRWHTVCPQSGKPPPRHAHTMGKVGLHSFLIFGGASQSHEVLADVWVFNTMTSEWKLVVPEGFLPAAREMAAGVMISSHQFVVIGGRGSGRVLLDDVVMLDLDGDPSWMQLLRHDSVKRCAHSAVAMNLPNAQSMQAASECNRTIAVFGGFVGQELSDELVLLDTHKRECTTIMHDQSDAWPLPRFAHAACMVCSPDGTDTMCVFGGLGADSDFSSWHVWDPKAQPVKI